MAPYCCLFCMTIEIKHKKKTTFKNITVFILWGDKNILSDEKNSLCGNFQLVLV